MSEAVAKKAAEEAEAEAEAEEEEEAEEEAEEEDDEDDGGNEEEPKGKGSPIKGVEPKNADKLSVKITGSGGNKRHQITGRAGSQPLLVRYGSGEYDFFRVPALGNQSQDGCAGHQVFSDRERRRQSRGH
jgi:hypothetical protein